MFAFDKEQRREATRKGIIARGRIPWSEEEIETICSKAQDPKYQEGETRIKTSLIAEELNRECHQNKNVRTSRTVGSKLYELKKRS